LCPGAIYLTLRLKNYINYEGKKNKKELIFAQAKKRKCGRAINTFSFAGAPCIRKFEENYGVCGASAMLIRSSDSILPYFPWRMYALAIF
jgi:hypothetical protein